MCFSVIFFVRSKTEDGWSTKYSYINDATTIDYKSSKLYSTKVLCKLIDPSEFFSNL